MSAAPVEMLDELWDAGLLESTAPGRYTLHQTIVDYADFTARDASVSARFVSYVLSYLQQHSQSHEALEEEANTIFGARITHKPGATTKRDCGWRNSLKIVSRLFFCFAILETPRKHRETISRRSNIIWKA